MVVAGHRGRLQLPFDVRACALRDAADRADGVSVEVRVGSLRGGTFADPRGDPVQPAPDTTQTEREREREGEKIGGIKATRQPSIPACSY